MVKKANMPKWSLLGLIFILSSCNTADKIKVNVPNTFCGYAFILIDKNISTHIVHLDKDGVGFLNKEDNSIGNPVEYEITCEGKDITSECSDFMITTVSSGKHRKHYLSFITQCERLKDVGFIDRNKRFDQLRNTPKVKKWLNN